MAIAIVVHNMLNASLICSISDSHVVVVLSSERFIQRVYYVGQIFGYKLELYRSKNYLKTTCRMRICVSLVLVHPHIA